MQAPPDEERHAWANDEEKHKPNIYIHISYGIANKVLSSVPIAYCQSDRYVVGEF